ncbi:thioredoxin family protein [Enterococcus faecium]|uniref:thioredoxin family protein n=1 Tax=Enterococcus faecium TaxID=1352 RepID=UPI0003A65869|nr:thioredoxin family protein [Enterococcus faecium]EZP97911.1 hypothetical protein Z971_14060 [Enterococcus faecium VRE0576]KFO17984.1 hypothetical protein L232_0100335 [Enterococcus faecium UC7267]KGK77820.1 hypothetical protein LK25_01010 [Enterococcus faecium]MCR9049901.1 thioredoxin family protein [Enterococcus faecium]PHL06367.1 thioredoxin [Enterococcus faecium]
MKKKGGIFIVFCLLLITGLYSYSKANNNDEFIVKNVDFINSKKETNEFVNLYFFKKGCQPCIAQKKDLNKVIINDKLKVYGIDIEDPNNKNNKLFEDLNITQTPTIITMKHGEVINRIEGISSYKDLEQVLIN